MAPGRVYLWVAPGKGLSNGLERMHLENGGSGPIVYGCGSVKAVVLSLRRLLQDHEPVFKHPENKSLVVGKEDRRRLEALLART